MDLISTKSSVVVSDAWSGVRGSWPLTSDNEQTEKSTNSPPLGFSSDFLVDLFHFHMVWLSNVSGLNEPEAKRRVLNLLKAGRIGYQDEFGKQRKLTSDAVVWVKNNI